MTQTEKELLLKDICARLPYGVIVETPKGKGHVCDINLTIFGYEFGVNVNPTIRDNFSINNVKPYLFPLSSMTEEQKREFYKFFEEGITESANETRQWLRTKRPDETMRPITIAYVMVHKLVIEWLLKNHFDYSGLIENGLAIDATGLGIY